MNVRFRLGIAGVTLLVVAVLVDFSKTADAHGICRRPLFSGGLLFRSRCQPMVVQPCESSSIPVAPAKEEPLPTVSKDLQTNVKNIANLLKRGKAEEARKLARAAAPYVEEVADLMHLYRPRKKGGLGWGPVVQTNPTDGIEARLKIFAKAIPAAAAKQPTNNEMAGYWIAAMAEITLAKAPNFSRQKLPKKGWIDNAEGLRAAALDLAKASAVNNEVGMRTAAGRIDKACNTCHATFKD